MHLKSSNDSIPAFGLSFSNCALILDFTFRLVFFLVGVVTAVVVLVVVDLFFFVVGDVTRVLVVVEVVLVMVVELLPPGVVEEPPVVLPVLLLLGVSLLMTVEMSGIADLPPNIPNTINKSNEIIPRSQNIKPEKIVSAKPNPRIVVKKLRKIPNLRALNDFCPI